MHLVNGTGNRTDFSDTTETSVLCLCQGRQGGVIVGPRCLSCPPNPLPTTSAPALCPWPAQHYNTETTRPHEEACAPLSSRVAAGV